MLLAVLVDHHAPCAAAGNAASRAALAGRAAPGTGDTGMLEAEVGSGFDRDSMRHTREALRQHDWRAPMDNPALRERRAPPAGGDPTADAPAAPAAPTEPVTSVESLRSAAQELRAAADALDARAQQQQQRPQRCACAEDDDLAAARAAWTPEEALRAEEVREMVARLVAAAEPAGGAAAASVQEAAAAITDVVQQNDWLWTANKGLMDDVAMMEDNLVLCFERERRLSQGMAAVPPAAVSSAATEAPATDKRAASDREPVDAEKRKKAPAKAPAKKKRRKAKFNGDSTAARGAEEVAKEQRGARRQAQASYERSRAGAPDPSTDDADTIRFDVGDLGNGLQGISFDKPMQFGGGGGGERAAHADPYYDDDEDWDEFDDELEWEY